MPTLAAQLETLPEDRVREALKQVVDSRDFPASPRLRRLLTFLIEQTLAGKQDTLNQRELACKIFARASDFDPELDPIVRVEVSKLRKALQNYYANSGHPHTLRISIPTGRYIPLIEPMGDGRSHGRSPRSAHTLGSAEIAHRQTLLIRPFTVLSTGDYEAQVAESLTDELEVLLARLPGLRVLCQIDQDISTACPGFTLQGAVKCEGSVLRINVRLLEGATGEMLWTERFEYLLENSRTLHTIDLVSATILARVADVYSGTISQSLMDALDCDKKSSFSCAEAMLFFYRYINSHSDESYAAARRAVEDAWSRDSENAILTALLADLRRAGYSLGFTDCEDPSAECLDLARSALALAPDSAACKLSVGFALLHIGRKTELLELVEDMIADTMLAPGYRGEAAMLLAFSGQWRRGCALMDSVLTLLPGAPHSFGYLRFLRAYHDGDYAVAKAEAERFKPSPLFWQPMMRAAAFGQTGDAERARQAVHCLLEARPKFRERGRKWISCFIMEPDLVEHLLDGLSKAGLRAV